MQIHFRKFLATRKQSLHYYIDILRQCEGFQAAALEGPVAQHAEFFRKIDVPQAGAAGEYAAGSDFGERGRKGHVFQFSAICEEIEGAYLRNG